MPSTPSFRPQSAGAPQYLTQAEVQAIYKLSDSFLEHDRTLAVPRIPFVKIGRVVRYRLTDTEAAMAAMTVGSRG